jgi:hypothetical protein
MVQTGMVCLLALLAMPGAAEACTREDFAKAVTGAGAALRKLNAENAPRLQAKMQKLKTKMGWADADYEAKAYEALHDERLASFDAGANTLLARIDTLGTIDATATPDCARLPELEASGIELQATVKAKSAYLLSKLDQMLGEAPASPSKLKSAAAKSAPPPPEPAPKSAAAKAAPPAESAPKAVPKPPDVAVVPPPPPAEPQPGAAAAPEGEGYTIEEIRDASAGLFGQVSASLGAVIEHLFAKSGRPAGYVLGTEGGGAFLAGVRYGKGTLYMRRGGTQQIFWHGPSLGFDVGGEGSKTLFLIYKLHAPEQLYANFTGIDGSAYLVGGVGATLMTNGTLVMAPIRSGIGLRLGANIGYIRFSPKATWNPF